jgi:hypothetical protein
MKEPQNLTQLVWVELCKAATICIWTAYKQPINVLKDFFMSYVDAGSSLRWLLPSTMTLCHHFDSTSISDPVPQNLS